MKLQLHGDLKRTFILYQAQVKIHKQIRYQAGSGNINIVTFSTQPIAVCNAYIVKTYVKDHKIGKCISYILMIS